MAESSVEIDTPRLVTNAPAMPAYSVRASKVLQVTLLLMLVANLGRIPVLSSGEAKAPILVNDFAVGFALVAGFVAMARVRAMQIDRVALAALVFAAIGGVSAILAVPRFGISPAELVVGLAYLARWLTYFGIYLVVVNTIELRDVAPVWNAMESMLLVFAGFGIVQSAFLPGFAQIIYPDSRVFYDWDAQGHRLVSTVLDPNIAGAMILVGLLVQLAQLASGANVARWKPAVLFVALVLTLSRSAALGLFAGGLVIVAAGGISKRLLRMGLAVGVVILALLPKLITFGAAYGKFSTGGSAAVRVITLLRDLDVFVDHPIIGVGFNTYGFVADRVYNVDHMGLFSNSNDGGLLFVAVLTGTLGLAAYVWMLSLVLRRCRMLWRSPEISPEQRGLAIGTAASIVAICVHSVFVNSLLTTFVMELLWVQWGLTFIIARALRERAQRTEHSSPVVFAALG